MLARDIRALEPTTYNEILGNQQLKYQLQIASDEKASIILIGKSGVGKSCIGRLYLGEYSEVSGTVLRTENIRCLTGKVLVNEFDTLDKKKQKMFIDLIDNRNMQFVFTVASGVSSIVTELVTRCKLFYVNYPKYDDIKLYIQAVLSHGGKELTDKQQRLVYSRFDNMRSLNRALLTLCRVESITDEIINTVLENIASPINNMEEVKSALQKSIRGSDVDASCIYAHNLLQNGFLEEMCRRLRIIASEDIGLANPNCVVVVNACLDNALKVGLPEAYFPVMQAVAFMALQPKSNSIHTIIDNCKKLPDYLKVPKNINSVHSKGYKYPHSYPNHWCSQNYMPENISNCKIYEPGINKIEHGYKTYWDKIKGENS